MRSLDPSYRLDDKELEARKNTFYKNTIYSLQ